MIHLYDVNTLRIRNLVYYKDVATVSRDSIVTVSHKNPNQIEFSKTPGTGAKKHPTTIPEYVKKILIKALVNKEDISKISGDYTLHRRHHALSNTVRSVLEELLKEIEESQIALWELTSVTEEQPPTIAELIKQGKMPEAYYQALDLLQNPDRKEDRK